MIDYDFGTDPIAQLYETIGPGYATARRPEAYLEASVREAICGIARLPPAGATQGEKQLACDLASGAWDNRYGALRSLSELDLGYRLLVAGKSPAEGR